MKRVRQWLAAWATFAVLVSPLPASAATAPIHFADLNWESGSLITDILRIIVEKRLRVADRHIAGHHHYPGNRPVQ